MMEEDVEKQEEEHQQQRQCQPCQTLAGQELELKPQALIEVHHQHELQESGGNVLFYPSNALHIGSVLNRECNLLVTGSTVHRKSTRKKKPVPYTRRVALEKKLQLLRSNLQPIPFLINKNDFLNHEDLFKRLGLWEFIHIEFEPNIRIDLLEQLIVTYNPRLHRSTVANVSIRLSRADIACAFKLPSKKQKVNPSDVSFIGCEALSDDSVSFIEEFVLNWVLLHEDSWTMPTKVVNWMLFIKDRKLEKVDWAGMTWYMVENEILKAPNLVHCYYASHLQYLMKIQKPYLFNGLPIAEVESEPEAEEDVEEEMIVSVKVRTDVKINTSHSDHVQIMENKAKVKEEEDVVYEEMTDVKMSGFDDNQWQGLEKQRTDLRQDKIVNEKFELVEGEDILASGDSKEQEGGGIWIINGKNSCREHLRQQCNSSETRGSTFISGKEKDIEEEDIYDLPMRSATNEILSPACIAEINEPIAGSCSSPIQLINHNSTEYFAPFSETSISMVNLLTRQIYGNDAHHFSLSEHHKRMKTDNRDFDLCMMKVNNWMDKIRMVCMEKDRACISAQISEQILMGKLQQKESFIQLLERAKQDEIQNKDTKICHLERELLFMVNLIDGYKKALKETRRTFTKYRERCL